MLKMMRLPTDGLILAEERERGYLYYHFDTYDELIAYHLKKSDSCHYEVVRGKQKLYFDLDCGGNQFDIDNFIQHLQIYMERGGGGKTACGFPCSVSIDVYSSCNSVKTSYHVVVNGIYFESHLECGIYAKRCAESYSSNFNEFDGKVYTSVRLFRMLGSRKYHDTRVKALYNPPQKHGDHFIFSDSLVTYIKPTDILIRSECPAIGRDFTRSERTSEQTRQSRCERQQLCCVADVREIIEQINNIYPNVFVMRNTSNGVVYFKRILKHLCHVCNRVHDNENVLAFKRGKIVMFRCLRAGSAVPLENDDDTVEVNVIPTTSTPSTDIDSLIMFSKAISKY